MVQPRDDGGVEDGYARADGLCRVVKQRLQVGHAREPEAGDALHGAVDDQVRSPLWIFYQSSFCGVYSIVTFPAAHCSHSVHGDRANTIHTAETW